VGGVTFRSENRGVPLAPEQGNNLKFYRKEYRDRRKVLPIIVR